MGFLNIKYGTNLRIKEVNVRGKIWNKLIRRYPKHFSFIAIEIDSMLQYKESPYVSFGKFYYLFVQMNYF